MKNIYSSIESTQLSHGQTGGKGDNLRWLTHHGYAVPSWWIIPSYVMNNNFLKDEIACELQAKINSYKDDFISRSKEIEKIAGNIRECILQWKFKKDFTDELSLLSADKYWAVRSSCTDEDGKKNSFAGQMDTLLFQQGHQQLSDAILKVMASAWNSRAVLYRLSMGLPLTSIGIAVIIQEMMPGQVSGVMFTAHPSTGSRKKMLISANWGCGEGIVSGRCNTDEYSISLEGTECTQIINHKDTAIFFDQNQGYGTLEVKNDNRKASSPALTKSQLIALRDIGATIAEQKFCPQDIEWTIIDNDIYILQTRPITHLPKDNTSERVSLVCDNSNIQESYCGITTPLTFSFASAAYAKVYEQTLRLIGCSAKKHNLRKPIVDNLLVMVKGRVFYNIQNWYRLLMLLPLFRINKEDMEIMMGLEKPIDMIKDKNLSLKDRIKSLPSLIRMFIKIQYMILTLNKRKENFIRQYEYAEKYVNRKTLHTHSPDELIKLLQFLDEHLLSQWTAPIINDFYVARFNGRVMRTLKVIWPESFNQIYSDLLSENSSPVSTAPTKMLLDMSEYIRCIPNLEKMITMDNGDNLLARLKFSHPEFYFKCVEYIERYGDRTIGELKLETITLRQDSTFLFTILRNYLNTDKIADQKMSKADAESHITNEISKKTGLFKSFIFKKNLKKLRKAINDRELLRFIRTKTFSLYRDIYLQLGQQFSLEGVIDNARDIFWLTREEIYQSLVGTVVQTTLRPLIFLRRQEYEGYKHSQEPSHHFQIQQTVFQQQDCDYQNAFYTARSPDSVFKGTGCYPGVVEARVRIISDPSDASELAGNILCTVRTDPGWAPLFPGLSGLIVERGSVLSHSAIIAREMGIPAIVGVPAITQFLRNGEKIRMNGSTGIVTQIVSAQDIAND